VYRNYVTQDILRRIMSDYFGYHIHFVQNVTDIDDKVRAACSIRDLSPNKGSRSSFVLGRTTSWMASGHSITLSRNPSLLLFWRHGRRMLLRSFPRGWESLATAPSWHSTTGRHCTSLFAQALNVKQKA
jgi:cysteinyl-tRNA synthetase